MTIRTCLCLIVRRTPRHGDEVLLGYKKAGFGAGRWVGLGGHIEDGEEPADAAVREVAEESGLVVSSSSLRHRASLAFVFPARPAWDQTADVFRTEDFLGEPAESDEVIPRWFAVDALPLGEMWDDARYWMPVVLSGGHVRARVTFASDCATVAEFQPDHGLPEPPPAARRLRTRILLLSHWTIAAPAASPLRGNDHDRLARQAGVIVVTFSGAWTGQSTVIKGIAVASCCYLIAQCGCGPAWHWSLASLTADP